MSSHKILFKTIGSRSAACILVAAIAFVGCHRNSRASGPQVSHASGPLTVEESKGFVPLKVNQIVVMPLEPINGEVALPQQSAAQLTDALIKSFQVQSGIEILNVSKSKEVEAAKAEFVGRPLAPRSEAAAVAAKVGAQGALYGVVTSFVDTGSTLEGQRISFRLWLIDPKTETTLWTASFSRENTPLSDNLLRLGEVSRYGLGFKPVQELAAQGFDAAAAKLEALRKQSTAQK